MAPIKIKLAVDMSWSRVLFADVGSDFVDVLLTFLTIPLSAVQLLPADASSLGCLCNLGYSVDSLSDSRLCNCKSTLIPLSSLFPMTCKCSLVFDRLLHVYEQVGRKETFVGGKQRYVISDDCTIKPASTSSMQSMPQAFNSCGTGHTFEVVEQLVEWEQVVAMLKASLSSDTILTDAFLPKESNYNAAHATVKPSISLKNLVSDRDSAGSIPESKIKVFYDTREKKVMYAECNHDFVDLLLGFTIHPVSSVIKNTGAGTCHLGRCLDNLYRSVTDLDDAGCLTGGFSKMMLLDPSVMPFDVSSKAMCKALDCRCRKDTMPDLARYCCHAELVEYGRFLSIHQGGAVPKNNRV
ncbi:hypothetical protein ACQ4PT_050712 [Festuca glaucescens]